MTIRRTADDFRVEERGGERLVAARRAFASSVAAPAPPTGEHALYELEKRSLSTPEANSWFARELGLKAGLIDYAGLKDKHAHTTQHVSVPRTALSAHAPSTVEGRGWRATLVGWLAEPLTAADIDGNAFRIVVRDLAQETIDEMDRRASLLRDRSHDGSPTLRVVNYFGAQRFGSARHGEGWIARALMKGDFEGALKLAIGTPARKDAGKTRTLTRLLVSRWGDWKGLVRDIPRMPERHAVEALARGGSFREAFAALPSLTQTMAVEAYQSHLWNRMAHAMVAARCAAAGVRPLKSDDLFGELLFPSAKDARPLSDVIVPLLSPITQPRDPWASAMRQVLGAEGITLADLVIPGLRRPFFGEAPRALMIEAAGVAFEPPEPDDLSSRRGRLQRAVRFTLPRGAYATVVLRALGQ